MISSFRLLKKRGHWPATGQNGVNCSVGLTISRVGQSHDFHPIGIFPHRVVVELREVSRLRVNLIAREGMGELSNREQVVARGVDIEPTRLRFGRDATNRRQRAVDWVDTEPGQGTRGALRPIEKSAVGGEVEIRQQFPVHEKGEA
jgi:hypothetical protein